MKKKPTKDIDKSLEELMLENLGAGTSQLPSDNLSMLDWDVREEPWIDAIHVADKNRDPQPLITLLEKERVPPRVMPFVAKLLKLRLGRPPGRPSVFPTRKQTVYQFAHEQIRELVAGGMRKADATKEIAARWGMKVKTLTGSGYARPSKIKAP